MVRMAASRRKAGAFAERLCQSLASLWHVLSHATIQRWDRISRALAFLARLPSATERAEQVSRILVRDGLPE
jgi:hypothetical protein